MQGVGREWGNPSLMAEVGRRIAASLAKTSGIGTTKLSLPGIHARGFVPSSTLVTCGEASLKRVEPFRQMCSCAENINALLANASAFAHWYSLKLPARDSARSDGESK